MSWHHTINKTPTGTLPNRVGRLVTACPRGFSSR